MPGSYVKDAYATVYKHNSWDKEARDYETSLGVMLYKSPYVISAAQTALVKLSKVLTAYYGDKPGGRTGESYEDRLVEATVLGDIASQISGQEAPTLDEHKEIKEPEEQGGEQPEKQDGEQPDDQVEETPETEEAPGEIPVTDTLMSSFLRNDPGSAGQIGTVNEGDELSRSHHMTDTYAVLNGDGNLREKMTMIFNSALMNGGMTDEQTSQSVSLKRVLRDVTREETEQNEGLSGLNMDAIEKVRKKGSDIFGIGRLVSKLGQTSLGEKISAFFGSKSRKRREAKPEGEEPGLGYEYYKQHGIKPSKREKQHAVTKVDGKKQLKWKEGSAYWDIDQSTLWAKKMAEKGRILTAGPSGTAQRMLSAYRFLGASDKELFDFRLALMGWMLTSQDHSLYEIMMGSQTVGVKGEEDISEAAEMYRTVYPLSTEQLRNTAAVEKEFPHERVFKTLLKEVARNRVAASGSPREDGGSLTYIQDPESHSARELAVNIYTTAAYKTMTPSQKYGSGIGKWQMRRNRGKNPDTDEGSYEGSLEDAKHDFDSELNDEIFKVIQVASRISYEGLAEASAKAPEDVDENGEGGEAESNHLATTAYKGMVYRGEGISKLSRQYNKVGNTVTLSAMTSTSMDRTRAENFRDAVNTRWKKPVLLTIKMNGISGIDISEISKFSDELEVLVPEGTQFKVTEALSDDGDGKYGVTLEEVAGKDTYQRRVKGIGDESHPLSQSQPALQQAPVDEAEGSFEEVDIPMSPELISLLEARKTELGDTGVQDYLDAMENLMAQFGPDSETYQLLQANGVKMSDKKYAAKLVNWYLACAMDFEFDETKTLRAFDLLDALKRQIPDLAQNQAMQLKLAPK